MNVQKPSLPTSAFCLRRVEEVSIFSFSLHRVCDLLRPNPRAFTLLLPVIEITFPDTLDTAFDPICAVRKGLDELSACGMRVGR